MAKKVCPIVKVSFYFSVDCEGGEMKDLGLLKAIIKEKLEEDFLPIDFKIDGSWWTGDRTTATLLSPEEAIEKLRGGSQSS